jgi:hypothetical protein
MNNFLCVLLAALAAALILGSCIRQDMRSAQTVPSVAPIQPIHA